ncbi:hypothetical protein PFICI_01029 [Pestalotiopsis fici W106-1]|uniref:DNA mismatch repair protein MSH3 n=1 Tax=Pestalotiopsis fici (strain W106-1 / CGMCC3.15140) TaxID=1229662 RepID=W3XPM4_PESFW|nr:uncharacterized protein PFICI_01029 [Pestalotiopsis fici W106-1]ETS87201.1 hypothetical protein PFICI_01029 [Pestalotiopsis fici W106-1]
MSGFPSGSSCPSAEAASARSSPYPSTPNIPLSQESPIIAQSRRVASAALFRERLNTLSGTMQSRTSAGTPHPSVSHARSRSSLSQRSYRSSGKRSVVSSSYPFSQRGSASTASGRKSRATSSIWGSDGHQVICAVSEARGVSPSVGLAFINVTTNEAILSQICDSQFYVKTIHKISMYDPDTILMASTAFPPNVKSTLLSMIEEEFHATIVESLDRKYWSETAGMDAMHNLVFREDLESIQIAMQGNFYATCAFAAAVRYLEAACHLKIMAHSLRLRYQPSENSMMIDISTIHSLELIQNIQDAKSKHCLFGLLNQTSTPMGARMLRSNVLQPSTQIQQTLKPRYDALDELTIKEDMFFGIRSGKFFPLETFAAFNLISRGSHQRLVIVPEHGSIYESEMAINHVLMIKSFVVAILPLYEALSCAQSELLQRIRDVCQPEVIAPIRELISATINEDVSYVKTPIDLRNQRTYAVKSGVHGLLDVARQTYKEGVDDVFEHVEKVKAENELSFDIKYDDNRKHYIRVKDCELEGRDIPDLLINRVRRGGYLECQTLCLVQLNNRITDSHNETVMLSDKVIRELLDAIRGHVANLFRACEGIALLDMLAAFGQAITTRDYIRPEFGDTLALKAARHPIIEMMLQGKFVPNDVYASEDRRFQIITGCNMSGKSTYIRMIALLQIMAQIGCFVPAEYAHFTIVEHLFVRMSTDDCIEANLSTFSTEMREMAFILGNINGKALAVIDELGRGTSTRDGLAIALAISEALIQSKSMIWFATHFHQLAKVLGSRPGVLNLHLGTDISPTELAETPKMTMLYKVDSGPLNEVHYGLHLAKVVGFPDSFLHIAETTSHKLRRQIERKRDNSQFQKLKRRRNLILQLHEMLKQMEEGDMDDAALGSYLIKLQNEFAERMDDIESRSYGTVVDDDDDEEESERDSAAGRSIDGILTEQEFMLETE